MSSNSTAVQMRPENVCCRTVIVNTRCANLASVVFSLRRLGEEPVVSDDSGVIAQAARVILPGVGSAGPAMDMLCATGLDRCIKSLHQPVLGICLGMQLLTEYSDESTAGDSVTAALGVIPGRVCKLRPVCGLRFPHTGWNTLEMRTAHPLLDGIAPDHYFYFVHSYALPEGDNTVAACRHGEGFSAVIARDNFTGVQFHPEKSGKAGALLLRNFLSLS